MGVDVSVIMVSDFQAGEEKSWQDMRAALDGLARQDFAGSFEVLLVEEERLVDAIPADLREVLPQLRIVASRATNSYALGNAGVADAAGEIVILLDADCTPVPGWLSSCVAALRANPAAGVVSGLTRYPGRTVTERIMAMLSRAYVHPRIGGGRTRHISNNNAGYRRAAYLAHPLPESSGVYASRLQAIAMEQGGWAMLFEPAMEVVHDYLGWGMEAEIRRPMAHGLMTLRVEDPSLPYAWVARLGPLSLPVYLTGRLLQQWAKCLTTARDFGVRPWQVPYAMALAVPATLLEVPGAWRALRRLPVGESVYR
jgi:hypothetical protein